MKKLIALVAVFTLILTIDVTNNNEQQVMGFDDIEIPEYVTVGFDDIEIPEYVTVGFDDIEIPEYVTT